MSARTASENTASASQPSSTCQATWPGPSAEPDVVLMDVRMPRMDGIEATRRIGLAGLRTRVLVLTTFDMDEHVYDALRAGASGFLLKDAGRERLVEGVRTVGRASRCSRPRCCGGSWITTSRGRRSAAPAGSTSSPSVSSRCCG